MVASAADSFHLNYNRLGAPGAGPVQSSLAVLMYNAKRGDMVFCADDQCKGTQKASGYILLSPFKPRFLTLIWHFCIP